jgi:hypothetical protein
MLLALSHFILSSYASCAKVKPFIFTGDNHSDRMDVGHPIAAGMALGMTHIMTKLW